MGLIAGVVKNGYLAAGGYKRQLFRAPFPGLASLCYHNILPDHVAGMVPFRPLHVSESRFRAHCKFLARDCVPVSLAQVMESLDGGTPLPPRAVLVTFDDGYRNMLTIAAPILAEYGIPATFFVCSGVLDGGLLWFDAAAAALGEDAIEPLKKLPADVLIEMSAEWSRGPGACPSAATMTNDELRALAKMPGTTIGAHSIRHAILARGTLPFQRDELAGSRAMLAEILGAAPETFAYPNGRPGTDFTPETELLAQESGYRLAFSTQGSFTRPNHSRFRLPRFLMTDIDAAELAHRLTHTWSRA